jgi:hypothetical protein
MFEISILAANTLRTIRVMVYPVIDEGIYLNTLIKNHN